MKFEAVLFDCDGVLVDSELITNGVLRDMLAEQGWHMTLQDCMAVFVGKAVMDERARIEAETGAKEFHTSARSIVYSKMEYRNENVPMGSSIVSSEFETVETDRKKVASYL